MQLSDIPIGVERHLERVDNGEYRIPVAATLAPLAIVQRCGLSHILSTRVIEVRLSSDRSQAVSRRSILIRYPFCSEDRRVWLIGGPIDVAENVWIGIGATILPGVSIGRDSVIAAGAVMADDVPARSLVTGTKATVRHT